MRVSLEIVPRSAETLLDGATLASGFPAISAVNIPDLLRFPLRSWDACSLLASSSNKEEGHPPFEFIPHLRAIDYDLDKPFPHADLLKSHSITAVLAVAGDPPQDMSHRIYPTGTVEFIKKLKKEAPWLTVYAAFDPYRSNISHELEYVRAKEDSGADGFMSQPFFDLRLLEIYAEYLEGKTVFWGVSPVNSEKSKNYWEARNRAVFPKSFQPSLEWNVAFGRRVIDFCRNGGFNLYLMPIKVDLRAYLNGLFVG